MVKSPYLGQVKLLKFAPSSHRRLGQDLVMLGVEVLDQHFQPIPDAQVSIWNERITWRSSGSTDQDGIYSSELHPDTNFEDPLEITVTYGGKEKTVTERAPSGNWLMSVQLDVDQPKEKNGLPAPGEPRDAGIPAWGWVVGGLAVAGLVTYAVTR